MFLYLLIAIYTFIHMWTHNYIMHICRTILPHISRGLCRLSLNVSSRWERIIVKPILLKSLHPSLEEAQDYERNLSIPSATGRTPCPLPRGQSSISCLFLFFVLETPLVQRSRQHHGLDNKTATHSPKRNSLRRLVGTTLRVAVQLVTRKALNADSPHFNICWCI